MAESSAASAAALPSTSAAIADACKEKGNKQFSAGHYKNAVDDYTEAIQALEGESDASEAEKKQRLPVLYCNRAFASLKLELYGDAIADASKALEVDPTFIKAYYRKGSAYLALAKYKDARTNFKAVLKIKAGDPDATAKLEICEKAIRKAAFEAAIASEQTMPLLQKLEASIASMTVDLSTYKGPVLPDIPPEGVTPATPEQCAADENAVNEHGISLKFVRDLMQYFKDQKMIPKKYALQMLARLKTRILDKLPSLVHVSFPHEANAALEAAGKAPVKFNVAGDTHGQYYDTLNMLEKAGQPSPTNPFLFNGDFVDRGSFGVENVLTLFAWKLLYPESVHMTRGNHEQATLTSIYGFKGEVVAKLDATVYDVFLEVFRALPLAVVIDKKVFVVHGGLFQKDGVKLEDVAKIDRFREPPEEGLMSDCLWSDPQPFRGRGPSKRGVGQTFGPDITERFLQDNELELVIRSHEVQDEGFTVMHGGKLITVFSAPRYCDSMENKGAVVQLDKNSKPSFLVFESVPHPPVRPMAYASGMAQFGL